MLKMDFKKALIFLEFKIKPIMLLNQTTTIQNQYLKNYKKAMDPAPKKLLMKSLNFLII